jgi:hypothetical protein
MGGGKVKRNGNQLSRCFARCAFATLAAGGTQVKDTSGGPAGGQTFALIL